MPPEIVQAIIPDVAVCLGKVDVPCSEAVVEGMDHRFWATPNEVHLSCDGVGTFLVRGGSEIIVEPLPGVRSEELSLPLQDWLFAILLYQRGLFLLHGSCINVNGNAVAFLGIAGSGKSTIAAALHAQGYEVIADEVIAIDTNAAGASMAGRPAVLPGSAQLKMWPDSLIALGIEPKTLPRLQPDLTKRAYLARSKSRSNQISQAPMSQGKLPLRRIYIITGGKEAASLDTLISPLSAQRTLTSLVTHSYMSHIGLASAVGASRSNFQQCAKLMGAVSLSRLQRSKCLAQLVHLTEAIEADVAEMLVDDLTHKFVASGAIVDLAKTIIKPVALER